MAKSNEKNCCICGKRIENNEEFNPFPIMEHGVCCKECFNKHVLPERESLTK